MGQKDPCQRLSVNLLVPAHCPGQRVHVEARDGGRQAEHPQEPPRPSGKRRVSDANLDPEFERGHHPNRDRFTMENPSIAGGRLDAVPQTMPEVQDLSEPRLLPVLSDHTRLKYTGTTDHLGEDVRSRALLLAPASGSRWAKLLENVLLNICLNKT